MNQLQQIIESLLFYKNEPVSFSWLASRIKIPEKQVRSEIEEMMPFYENRGLALLQTHEEVSLVSSEIGSSFISELIKSSEEKELSKQALETLAIVAYKGKVTKSEIDYIRGVNSIFILRNLLMRGLIIKQINQQDKRSPLYSISHDLLSYLGITNVQQLADYDLVVSKLDKLEQEYYEEQQGEGSEDPSLNLSNE